MTTPGRIAHQIATQHEVDTRRALEEAIEILRSAGGTYDDVQAYLARCSTAGHVIPLAEFRAAALAGKQPV